MTEPGSSNPGGAGIGVDAHGGPVVDPTANVLQLVEAAITRQDDLREAEKDHIREVLDLRTKLGEQDSVCAGELAQLRADYAHRIDGIRENHAQQLRDAEAARIDAIRAVDVEAVQRAAEVQATQAATLATQVATTSEAMRAQVAAAATAAQTALAAALEPIIKDIADLRRAQYEAQGQKTQVIETQAHGASAGLWVGIAVAGFLALISVIGAVVAMVA